MKKILNVACICFGVMFHQDKNDMEIPIDALNLPIHVFSSVPGDGKGSSHVNNEYNSSINYPNPFSLSTTIMYKIGTPGNVTITIFDLLGREVCGYKEGFKSIGETEMKIELGFLNSGVYFYEIKVDGRRHAINKMLIVK